MSTLQLLGIIGIVIASWGGIAFALFWKDLRPWFRPNHVFASIINPDKTRTILFVRPVNNEIIVGNEKYTVDPACAYLTGRFRVATFYYLRGFAAPLKFEQDKVVMSEALTAEAHHIATENHIASDALRSLDTQIPMWLVGAIAGIIALLGVGFLYMKWNGSINQIGEIHKVVVPTPTPENAPDGGF